MISRRGQGWTVDYAVSILIFIIAGILAIELLVNTFPSTSFDEVKREGIIVSNSLLKEGVPEYWQAANVLRIGLTSSKNRIKEPKINNFMEIAYDDTRRKLGIKHDYAFYFVDGNGTQISIGSECSFGSPELNGTQINYTEILPSAYYFTDEQLMNAYMTAWGSDFYDGNIYSQADAFYNSMNEYAFILMEIPQIDTGGTLTTAQKIEAVEDFVREGGILFLTETVGVNLTGVTFTSLSEPPDGFIKAVPDPYFDLSPGTTIIGDTPADPAFAPRNVDAVNYTMMVDYLISAEDYISRWRFGLGKVYYIPTIDATYTATAGPFEVKVDEAIGNILNTTRANCTSLGSVNSENVAKIERLAVHDSEIIKMVVLAWT